MEKQPSQVHIYNMDTIHEVVLAVDWIMSIFIVFSLATMVGGTLVNALQNITPKWMLQMAQYGKVGEKSHKVWFMTMLEVPKKWFVHFYITGSCLTTVLSVLLWRRFGRGEPVTLVVSTCLDYMTTPTRASVDATNVVIASILFSLHIYRRLYENLFVSKMSSARMNVIFYIIGHVHYIGALVTLLSATPSLYNTEPLPSVVPVSTNVWVSIVIFIAANILQHDSLRRLASLRKAHTGDSTRKAFYNMPVGGGFEWVSCPHMLAEILVYFCLLFILSGHTGWMAVTSWVVINQVNVAIMNHQWYKETFKDYPLKRKAVIPFLI